MKVAVIGASGNIGTSVLAALAGEEKVDSIVGIARRRPSLEAPKTDWALADIAFDDLTPHLEGVDVAVHLAWAIQPSRDAQRLWQVNVEGSRRVFDAIRAAEVPALAYSSSVGAYSPGPKDRAVDESWPTQGIQSSFYSRHKAEVERLLDRFEAANPDTRVVRLRPGLVFKGEAAAEIRRLFAGPFLPTFLVEPRRIPVVPSIPGLRFQAVHSRDVGEAFRLAITSDAKGAFNLAADPVLDPDQLSKTLDARQIPVPARVVRTLADLSWRLRLQPSPPGWIDMALGVPIMDTARARSELGWQPAHTSEEALRELLHGMSSGEGEDTPPLDPKAGGRLRGGEIASGVGSRND